MAKNSASVALRCLGGFKGGKALVQREIVARRCNEIAKKSSRNQMEQRSSSEER